MRRNLKEALKRGRLDEATILLNNIKDAEPLAIATRGFELEFLIKSGRRQEAVILGDQLLAQFPESSRIQFLVGDLAYQNRNYDKAEACFRESGRLFPHWRSRWRLGQTLTQLNRLDEARPLLEELVTQFYFINRDLAWCYERSGAIDQAIACHQKLLAAEPSSQASKANLERLKALQLEPEELVEELDNLTELGEEVPDHLLPDYVARLFSTGQAIRVRNMIAEKAGSFSPALALKVGWNCFHAKAYDLAFDLLLKDFAGRKTGVKYLGALESAALKSGRTHDLVKVYEEYASSAPNLYGRAKRLIRREGGA